VAFKKFMEKLGASPSDRDRAQLADALAGLGVTPIADIELRVPQRVAGEIESVRVVPRASADAIEATISDGSGLATIVFLGRRRIPGVSPGRRILVEGVPARAGMRTLIYNPSYTLLTAR